MNVLHELATSSQRQCCGRLPSPCHIATPRLLPCHRKLDYLCLPDRRRNGPAALPFVQAWSTSVDLDAQSLAANLFASSIVPYAGFLYHLQKSRQAPKTTMFGFYFLLVFVGVTIPAGIWAKVHYHSSLSNVDWLHGTAESMLTLTNLLIVLGLRQGLRQAEQDKRRSAQPDNEPEPSMTE